MSKDRRLPLRRHQRASFPHSPGLSVSPFRSLSLSLRRHRRASFSGNFSSRVKSKRWRTHSHTFDEGGGRKKQAGLWRLWARQSSTAVKATAGDDVRPSAAHRALPLVRVTGEWAGLPVRSFTSRARRWRADLCISILELNSFDSVTRWACLRWFLANSKTLGWNILLLRLDCRLRKVPSAKCTPNICCHCFVCLSKSSMNTSGCNVNFPSVVTEIIQARGFNALTPCFK